MLGKRRVDRWPELLEDQNSSGSSAILVLTDAVAALALCSTATTVAAVVDTASDVAEAAAAVAAVVVAAVAVGADAIAAEDDVLALPARIVAAAGVDGLNVMAARSSLRGGEIVPSSSP